MANETRDETKIFQSRINHRHCHAEKLTFYDVAGGETASDPPERIRMVLHKVPKPEVWGKVLADLYRVLVEKITEHIAKEPHSE